MEKILRRDRSPLAENPYAKTDGSQMSAIERQTAAAGPLDHEMQKHLTNFSLITHGFGGPAMVADLNAFRHYLNSMKTNYEKILANESKSSGYSMSNRNNTASYFMSQSPSSSSSSSSSSISSRTQNSIELASLKVESKD